MKVKLYRHTIESINYVGDENQITIYYQTGWNSLKDYAPGENRKVILTEEKEIEVNNEN